MKEFSYIIGFMLDEKKKNFWLRWIKEKLEPYGEFYRTKGSVIFYQEGGLLKVGGIRYFF